MDVSMVTTNQEGAERDYEDFLEELEEDKTYRSNVNIFFSELGGRFLVAGFLFHCVCLSAWPGPQCLHNTHKPKETLLQCCTIYNIASSIIIHLHWMWQATCVLLSCSNVYSVH